MLYNEHNISLERISYFDNWLKNIPGHLLSLLTHEKAPEIHKNETLIVRIKSKRMSKKYG